MAEGFPVIDVPDDASDELETMGSKDKFWFDSEQHGRSLYKIARPGTGEDWAEKIAAELAELLGLPHAQIELAAWRDTRGTISPTLLRKGSALVEGNVLLSQRDPEYPRTAPGDRYYWRVQQHTLDAVFSVIERSLEPPIDWVQPRGVATAAGVFVGYLLLDAWIGNTDRHHENWGCIEVSDKRPEARGHLAPTYDHASSLGRELPDETRAARLATKDRGFSAAAYARKAASRLFASPRDKRALSTLDAFRAASERHPHAASAWIDMLADIPPNSIVALLDRVPRGRLSREAAEFARAVLETNRKRLIELR